MRWFVVLAEEENVSAAAERVGVPQPTLSRRLARLEQRLGTRLFERQGRRLRLNDAGRAFATHAERADAELAAGEQQVRDLATGGPRTVRLGFLHSFGTWLVPDLIERAHDRDPSLRFELVQGSSEVIAGYVQSGAVELGIVSPRPSTGQLTWHRLLRQEIVLAVPSRHRFAGLRSVRPEELAEEPIVTMQPGFGMRQILDELADAAGFTPHIAAQCQELSTVAALVASRIGVGLVPQEEQQHEPTGMTTVRLAGVDSGRDIGLIWLRGHSLSAPAARLRALARR